MSAAPKLAHITGRSTSDLVGDVYRGLSADDIIHGREEVCERRATGRSALLALHERLLILRDNYNAQASELDRLSEGGMR